MTSVPVDVPAAVLEQLRAHGQEHVLAWWNELDGSQRRRLIEQVQGIDFQELTTLFERKEEKTSLPEQQRVAALPRPQENPAERARHRKTGADALRRGAVAFLVVAGGQGTRLGFDHPKGMFPIGPVSRKTLFQIHAEKILALRRRYGGPLPFLVMTSPATDEETRRFFQERHASMDDLEI